MEAAQWRVEEPRVPATAGAAPGRRRPDASGAAATGQEGVRAGWTYLGPVLEPEPVECAVSECEPLELALVEGKAESRRWREQVERHHYLGCRVPFGANLRYWVRNRERELACLLWTSPAWKMQARDEWIGWSDEQRQRNLQRIVNNGRFLILPWVRVKGLASKILALSARRLPHDWESRYGYRPLLLETLVDASPFSRNLLSCRQLDPCRANRRTRSHGPGAQKLTVKPSKTSISIRWSATHVSTYAVISRGKQIQLILVWQQALADGQAEIEKIGGRRRAVRLSTVELGLSGDRRSAL